MTSREGQIRWVGTADQVGTAEGPTILLPPDPVRAARWRQVVAAHTDAAPAHSPTTATTAPADHVVALVAGAEPWIGESLSRDLGRCLVSFRTLADVERWITTASAGSLLLVVEPHLLGIGAIDRLNRAVLAHDHLVMGLVTGADAAARSFAAAKCRWGPAADERRSIDALGRDVEVLDGARAGADLATLVSDPVGELLVLAHGEGAHLNLHGVVLCGVLGERETVAAAELPGGCQRDGPCKKVRSPATEVVAVTDLAAEHLYLLSCGSFSVAGELYPSSSSLVLAGIESRASTVIAIAHQLPIRRGQLDLLRTVLDSGLPRGEVVRVLNESEVRSGAAPSYVLCGDPLSTVAPRPGTAASLVCAGPVPPVVEVAAGAVAAAGRMVVPVGVDPAVVDRTDDLRTQLETVERLGAGARFAAMVERGLALTAPSDTPPEARRRLTQAGRAVEAAVWRASAFGQAAAVSGHWRPSLVKEVRRGLRAAIEWQRSMTEVAEALIQERSAGLSDSLLPTLHPYPSSGSRPGEPCDRCGATTVVRQYELTALAVPARVTVECPLCGPLVDHARSDQPCHVRLVGEMAPGGLAAVRVDLPPQPPLPGPRAVVGQVRDKSKSVAFSTFCHLVPDRAETTTEVPVAVPDDARFDMWTVRVAVVGPLSVTFARRIHTPVPSP